MNQQWIYLVEDGALMRGATVRRWQEALNAILKPQPPVDVDGAFGPLTHQATLQAQKKLGVDADGIVGENTWRAAEAYIEALPEHQQHGPNARTWDLNGVTFVDSRGLYPWPKNGRYLREWSQISGVMIHRTACVLGDKPERWAPVNAHIGVTLSGRVFIMHPLELMIWHGHGPSPWTIGIEFDGNPEGKPGYWWKPGGGPHDLTPEQERASVQLGNWLATQFAAGGVTIKHVLAHRQSSKDRECDPGWQAWQKVGVPWLAQFGATPGPREGHPPTEGLKLPVGWSGDTWGDGFQIPTEWDHRSDVPFWSGR